MTVFKVVMFCVIMTSTCNGKLTTFRGREVSLAHLSVVFDDLLETITSTIECAAICSKRNCAIFGHCEDDNSCMIEKNNPGSTSYSSTTSGYPYSSTKTCHLYSENGFFPKIGKTVSPKPDCGQRKKDVIFVIDESKNVLNCDFSHEKQFISDVIDKYNLSSDAIRMAVVGFGQNVNTRISLSDYTDNLAGAQGDINSFAHGTVGAQSFVHKALNKLKTDILTTNKGDRPTVDNVVILITASPAGNSVAATTAAVDNLLSTTNTELFVISITPGADSELIQYIASDPDVDHIFYLNNFGQLNALKEIAAKFTCDSCNPPCQNNNPCNRRRNICECSSNVTGYRCETPV